MTFAITLTTPALAGELIGNGFRCADDGEFTIQFKGLLPTRCVIETFYEAEVSGTMLSSVANVTAVATPIRTRVLTGTHIAARIPVVAGAFRIEIDEIETSELPGLHPVGVTATLTDQTMTRNSGKVSKLSCSPLF